MRRRELAVEAEEKVACNSAVIIASLEEKVQKLENKLVLAETRAKELENKSAQEKLNAEKVE